MCMTLHKPQIMNWPSYSLLDNLDLAYNTSDRVWYQILKVH